MNKRFISLLASITFTLLACMHADYFSSAVETNPAIESAIQTSKLFLFSQIAQIGSYALLALSCLFPKRENMFASAVICYAIAVWLAFYGNQAVAEQKFLMASHASLLHCIAATLIACTVISCRGYLLTWLARLFKSIWLTPSAFLVAYYIQLLSQTPTENLQASSPILLAVFLYGSIFCIALLLLGKIAVQAEE